MYKQSSKTKPTSYQAIHQKQSQRQIKKTINKKSPIQVKSRKITNIVRKPTLSPKSQSKSTFQNTFTSLSTTLPTTTTTTPKWIITSQHCSMSTTPTVPADQSVQFQDVTSVSSPTSTITPRLLEVQEQLRTTALKYQRDPSTVQLLAVTKTHPCDAVLEAYQLGQRHFGENYVNELVEKWPQLPNDIHWHFIGSLQSNKAKFLAQIPNLALVESIDSTKLASKLNNEVNKAQWVEKNVLGLTKMPILIQINTSFEPQKGGIEPEDCCDVVDFITRECPLLQIAGFMTIGKIVDTQDDDDSAKPYFNLLVKCRDDVITKYPTLVPSADKFILSMGMTGDYEDAIECGSTEIRIGTAIFGKRVYLNKKAQDATDITNNTNNNTSATTNNNTSATTNNTNTTTTSTVNDENKAHNDTN